MHIRTTDKPLTAYRQLSSAIALWLAPYDIITLIKHVSGLRTRPSADISLEPQYFQLPVVDSSSLVHDPSNFRSLQPRNPHYQDYNRHRSRDSPEHVELRSHDEMSIMCVKLDEWTDDRLGTSVSS